MSSYRLSGRAAHDLARIYLYGIDNFGKKQAEKYKLGFDNSLALLGSQPRMGRLAEQIGVGVRRHAFGSHVIFYRIKDDHIRILAVVHGRNLHRLRL